MQDNRPKLTIDHVVEVKIDRTDPTKYPKVAIFRDVTGAEQSLQAAAGSSVTARLRLGTGDFAEQQKRELVDIQGTAGDVLRILEIISDSAVGLSMTVSIAGEADNDDIGTTA